MKLYFPRQIIPTLTILAAISFAVSGCGKKTPLPGPAPQPAHGKVTFQGRPAKAFRVALYPVTKWKGAQFAPSAVTDENGEFRVTSYKPGDGAPAGEYTVTFTWPKKLRSADDDGEFPEVDQLQGQYGDPNKSTFRVTIQEGDNELPPFALK